MTLTVHDDIEQRSEDWYTLRCGVITASAIGKLITPKTLKVATNDYSRDLTASLTAEQITGYVEQTFQSSDMLRGVLDEPFARDAYAEWAGVEVTEAGFMIRDDWGFPIGFSPDGLVGDPGLIEIKSRRQKKHLQTVLADEVPIENMGQIQCGLLVSGRSWCDYVSYSSGMALWVKRVWPDPRWQDVIVEAATSFYELSAGMRHIYMTRTIDLPMTERIDHFEEVELKL